MADYLGFTMRGWLRYEVSTAYTRLVQRCVASIFVFYDGCLLFVLELLLFLTASPG